MFSFKVRPKKLKSYTFSIAIPLTLSCRLSTFLLVILWTIYLDFFTFSDNLFKPSHSLILLSSLFISVSTVSLGFVDLIDCNEADSRLYNCGKGRIRWESRTNGNYLARRRSAYLNDHVEEQRDDFEREMVEMDMGR